MFVGCWVVLHHWFYARHVITDTPVYEGYGSAIDHGLLPYRDFPVEYPPGALPVFVAPVYLYGYAGYAQVFGWLMAALGVGCLAVAAVAGARSRALAFIAVSPLLIGSIALSRYDFWPTLLVLGTGIGGAGSRSPPPSSPRASRSPSSRSPSSGRCGGVGRASSQSASDSLWRSRLPRYCPS